MKRKDKKKSGACDAALADAALAVAHQWFSDAGLYEDDEFKIVDAEVVDGGAWVNARIFIPQLDLDEELVEREPSVLQGGK